MCPFPRDTVVRVLAFVDACLSGCTEVVVVVQLGPLGLIEEALFGSVYLIDIVTYLSVGSTQLQVVEP